MSLPPPESTRDNECLFMWVEGFPNDLYFSLFCSCEGSIYPIKFHIFQKNSEQSQEIA